MLNLAHYLCAPAAPDELADAIGAIARRAAARGLEVALEFMPDGGIPDLASATALLRAVAAPNLGLTIDTWHLFRTRAGPEELRELPRGAIRALQIADARADLQGTGAHPPSADRLCPGEGSIPLVEITACALHNHPGLALGVEVFDRSRLGEPALQRARAAAHALRGLLAQLPGGWTSGDL
jgi:sugar phosphate isomerase/epimerase